MNEDLQAIAFRLAGIMRDLQSVIAKMEPVTPREASNAMGAPFFQALTADDDDAGMGRQQRSRFEQCPHN